MDNGMEKNYPGHVRRSFEGSAGTGAGQFPDPCIEARTVFFRHFGTQALFYLGGKMKRNGLLFAGLAAASALGTSEAVLRLRDRANAKARFQRERWTLERSWERFDPWSGWELREGYFSESIRVNRDGFRGQELEDSWAMRIVCLGGDATFGPFGETNTWPHALQEELRQGCGFPVEAVNAGVTGHSTYNMLFRMNRVLNVHPEMVIILAGSEDLSLESIFRYRDNRQRFNSFWHIESQRNIHSHLWSLFRETTGLAERKAFPLSYSPPEFTPFNFEYNLSRIVSRIRRNGAGLALVTFPRFVPDDLSRLTEEDGRRVDLPGYFEDSDLEGFTAVCRAYDRTLRLLADENGLPLIEAARFFDASELPRERLFEGLFTLTAEGNGMLGAFIARELREKGLVG